mgnify:FL=1|jgi:hypothetical protein|tara:strand:+ start:7387 stop:8301 length:915 start_codon:yes stop_codon:yes gene_type:complete
MLINFKEQLDKLNQVRTGKIKGGLKLNCPSLDEHIRFKRNNFNVILGHANVGKTTVILYLMLLYTLRHNIRWLVYSSENEAYSLIRKLCEYICCEPINKINKVKLDKSAEYVDSHFKFVNVDKLYSYKDLLDLAENIKKAWDYDGLLVDPYNSLIKDKEVLKGINSHEYDYQATSEIRLFCKKNNVTVWLNTHAATEALRKKHGKGDYYEGHPIPPMASDVEGGGKFVNRADDFFVIHRYIQHPTEWMYSMIHTRKIKDTDTGSRPTPIDNPIRLRSIINNVGFEIDGKNLIKDKPSEKKELPF